MKKILIIFILLVSMILLTSQKTKEDIHQGIASYYHNKYNGRKTANGEIYNSTKYTGASNTLKLGSYVKVTNPENGKSIYVKITDRLAKYNKRLIDLSKVSANALGYVKKGITTVIVKVVPEDEAKDEIIAQNIKNKKIKNKSNT